MKPLRYVRGATFRGDASALKSLKVEKIQALVAEASKSNAGCSDGEIEYLEHTISVGRDDSAVHSLMDALRALTTGEMADLKALMWVGRGDFMYFCDAVVHAKLHTIENDVEYVAEKALLAQYLCDGAAALGVTISPRSSTGG